MVLQGDCSPAKSMIVFQNDTLNFLKSFIVIKDYLLDIRSLKICIYWDGSVIIHN